jgi:hypothetical protein
MSRLMCIAGMRGPIHVAFEDPPSAGGSQFGKEFLTSCGWRGCGLDAGVTPRYTFGMKRAISLPDDLYASADTLAKRLGMTRSGLIAAALAEFVAKHRASKVTERLGAVHSTNDSRLDTPIARTQSKAVRKSDW